MEFNADNFKQFRKDFDNALAAVADKHKLSIVLGDIKYQRIPLEQRSNVKELMPATWQRKSLSGYVFFIA